MTEIGQSVFKLCERKEKNRSVDQSVGYIQTHASAGLAVNQFSIRRGYYRMAIRVSPDMLTRNPLFEAEDKEFRIG